MGIDDEDLPFIFEPYFRGKKAYMSKGSGLGLHLVKFIAEQHKGRAYAIKQPVCGMQFVIELPLTI
jgi:signal transduction histidine kinase